MTDTMTREELAERLDALDDDDLIQLLGDLETGRPDRIPFRDDKITATVAAIRRRPFAAFVMGDEPVTESTCMWALARLAVFAPLENDR